MLNCVTLISVVFMTGCAGMETVDQRAAAELAEAALEEAAETCTETVGECEVDDAACLHAFADCIYGQGIDAHCVVEQADCVERGEAPDACGEQMEGCVEAQFYAGFNDDTSPPSTPNQPGDPAGAPPARDADILAIGDSVLAWNAGESMSIPDYVGQETGMTVTNAAISGSQMLDAGPNGIPNRYRKGPWRWVVLNGGANDFPERCGCGVSDCDAVVDDLVSSDTDRGRTVELIDQIVADGASVALLGYYDIPGTDFDGCKASIRQLSERYRALANGRPNVVFVDGSQIIQPTDASSYDGDQVHPSTEGSAAIGRAIASAIQSAP